MASGRRHARTYKGPDIRYNPTRSLGTPSSWYPARMLTPPSPATGFQLPASTKALVDRGRLIHVLRGEQGKKLTVIHGPTGFGKSTLAAQWAKLLTAKASRWRGSPSTTTTTMSSGSFPSDRGHPRGDTCAGDRAG